MKHLTDQEELSKRLLLHIISDIAKYAHENDMNVDDCICDAASLLLTLTEIATFNNFDGNEEAD
jgi:hypothetical protein